MTRKRSLQYGAAGGVALYLPRTRRTSAAAAATGLELTKYLEPLPLPGNGIVVASATPSGSNHYSFTRPRSAGNCTRSFPSTPLWAYDDCSGLGVKGANINVAALREREDRQHDLLLPLPRRPGRGGRLFVVGAACS